MFSVGNIIALGVGTLLGIGIPTAAAVIFKLKNREAWVPSVFAGAATFLVFAMILEQILHSVMLPIVKDNTAAYCVYGVLAAGIFEETGRLAAYKTLMKNHYSTKNAVFMGIGHGGFEAVMILGLNMLAYFAMAVFIGIVGNAEQFMVQNSPIPIETAAEQVKAILRIGMGDVALSVYERVISMIFHICMSVWVYKAVSQKGKIWLYPAAIAAHAVLDLFAVLYQRNVLANIAAVYVPMTVLVGVIVFITVKLAKRLPDKTD